MPSSFRRLPGVSPLIRFRLASQPAVPSVLSLLNQQFPQIDDQGDVEEYYARGEEGRAVGEMSQLERQVEPRRNHGEPFGPVFGAPQSIGFRQTDQRVGERHGDDLAGVLMSRFGERFDEEPPIVSFGVDSVPDEECVRGFVQIRMAQGKKSAAGGEGENTLCALEQRNRSQGQRWTARRRGMRSWFLTVVPGRSRPLCRHHF